MWVFCASTSIAATRWVKAPLTTIEKNNYSAIIGRMLTRRLKNRKKSLRASLADKLFWVMSTWLNYFWYKMVYKIMWTTHFKKLVSIYGHGLIVVAPCGRGNSEKWLINEISRKITAQTVSFYKRKIFKSLENVDHLWNGNVLLGARLCNHEPNN